MTIAVETGLKDGRDPAVRANNGGQAALDQARDAVARAAQELASGQVLDLGSIDLPPSGRVLAIGSQQGATSGKIVSISSAETAGRAKAMINAVANPGSETDTARAIADYSATGAAASATASIYTPASPADKITNTLTDLGLITEAAPQKIGSKNVEPQAQALEEDSFEALRDRNTQAFREPLREVLGEAQQRSAMRDRNAIAQILQDPGAIPDYAERFMLNVRQGVDQEREALANAA